MADNAFFPWPPLGTAVEQLASLGDREYLELKDEIRGPSGLDRDLPRLERIRHLLGDRVEIHEVFSLLASLEFFYDRVREWREEGDGASPSAQLATMLRVSGVLTKAGEREEAVLARINEIVAPNAVLERERKLHWLRTGMLPTAISFASFVDLRPAFNHDRTEVTEFVPSVLFQVTTETQYGDESSVVIQLTEQGLTKLQVVLEDIDRKLALLKRFEGVTVKGDET